MQPYRRTDRGRPAPRRVRGGPGAPLRTGCGLGHSRRDADLATRPPGPRGGPPASGRRRPARARPSADGWARSGAWERRERDGLEAGGGVPEIHHQGQDVQTSTRATRRTTPSGGDLPETPATSPRPRARPGRTQPHARAPASRRPGGTGRTAGQSGPGRARARGRPRPGQTRARDRPCHAHDAG